MIMCSELEQVGNFGPGIRPRSRPPGRSSDPAPAHDEIASVVSASVIVVDTDTDIERAARTLAETAGSPVRVILFGSHAREDARAGSDLDFLVIEPKVVDRHAEMVRLRSALHDLRRPIDVLVYSEAQVEEWGDAPGTALYAALAEGRVLVEA